MNSAIILAGGKSSRVGQNKALLDLQGLTLIEIMINELSKQFDNIYIITLNKEEYSFIKNPKVQIIEDLLKENKNILEAIYTGLIFSDTEYNFVTSCDRPYINIDLIKYLYSFTNDYDIVCPVFEYKPAHLHAFYSKKCSEIIKKRIDKGDKNPSKIYRDFNVKYIQEEEIISLFGSNKYLFQIRTYLDYLLCQ